jgi:CRP/FNR family cyclic AMP-dependent transcriptional regulator
MSDSPDQPELPALGFATDLSDGDRKDLGAFGEFITCNEGDILISEAKPQDSLFLVVFGSFHVQTETTGRVVLLGRLKSGDTVGEVNIFDPGNASASVVARNLGQVWRIDRTRLEDFLEAHPQAAARLMVGVATQLSKRLRKTNDKVAMVRESMLDSF